jgi:hypothetical protein
MTFKMATAKQKTKVKGLPWTARLANPPWTAAMEGRLTWPELHGIVPQKMLWKEGFSACAELHVIVCKVCPELQGLPWNAWHCATEYAMDGSTVSTLEPGSAKRWPKVQGLPWNARHCATENAVDIPAVAIISSYQYVWYKRETGEIFLECSLQLIVNAQTVHIFWQSVHTVHYLPGMTVQLTDATALQDNAQQL